MESSKTSGRRVFAGGDGTPEFKFVQVGDRLKGRLTAAETISTKFGEKPLIRVLPEIAISRDQDVSSSAKRSSGAAAHRSAHGSSTTGRKRVASSTSSSSS